MTYSRSRGSRSLRFAVSAICAGLTAVPVAFVQAQEGEGDIEEITVTGSQIRGAAINDALAVSVFSSEDVDIFGVQGGDELLASIPENGQNFLSPTDTGGGVNGARGDVGAVNLRSLGTGNTLVLLNGRRMVNMATFQTEVVGGSFVPVNSVNSNHLPVFGLERVEVLRDGASAIYGADAVAGVVNTVTKDNFEGFTVRLRQTEFDHMPRGDTSIAMEWGDVFNGGRTSVGAFARYYTRDRVRSSDEARWSNSDFRDRFPEDSPYRTSTVFRNDSANSLFGGFDLIGFSDSPVVNPSDGRFEMYPSGDERCATGADTGYGTCLAPRGQGLIRYNLNQVRDVSPSIDRTTFFAYVNHEISDELEFFADAYFYDSSSTRSLNPSAPLTAVRLRVGPENYWNPFGPVGSPNRLPDSVIGPNVPAEGVTVDIRNYRFAEIPRTVNNDGDAYRVVGGLRGIAGDWDWESAVVYSEATRTDITSDRVSNTLITEALFDPTPAAYNPFSAGADSNLDRALVDVFRKGETSLASFDVKLSNAELFEMPAGPVGFLVGYEARYEDYVDDRDPRLDGTIDFVDFEGEGYPFTSDIVNSSPTPDGEGSRTTNSVFAELQMPVFDTLDVQLAARYENFNDVGDTTVGKIAFGWTPLDPLLIRGSVSTAFRAPNLITINEEFVARTNTRDDWVCFYAVDNGSLPDDTFSDCDYGMQRQATGSTALRSEESLNTSFGLVFTPWDELTITADYWTIEKDDTIGLFGEENHVLTDLVVRLEQGIADCDNVVGWGAVTRDAPTDDPVEIQGFLDAGLCPVGEVTTIADTYANLDTRTISGFDVGLYYDMDTNFGLFSFKFNGSFIDTFEQDPGGLTIALQEAQAQDPLVAEYPIRGIGRLRNINGNQSERMTASLRFQRDNWSTAVSGTRIGSYIQQLSNGDDFPVASMTTLNFTADYGFDFAGVDSRIRLGVNNFLDERAPIYDRSFGFDDDSHGDWGIFYYADLMLRFGS